MWTNGKEISLERCQKLIGSPTTSFTPICHVIGHICILGTRLDQACNGGSYREKIVKKMFIHLHLKRPPALASLAS